MKRDLIYQVSYPVAGRSFQSIRSVTRSYYYRMKRNNPDSVEKIRPGVYDVIRTLYLPDNYDSSKTKREKLQD